MTDTKEVQMSAEEKDKEVQREAQAAEARLLEFRREVQCMIEAERQVHPTPGWETNLKLEWITEEQANRLYLDWLSLQVRRHAERPDLYGPVQGHNGQRMMRMLAYLTEKLMRLREIQAEVHQIQEHYPSPRVAEGAAEITRWCEWLEEIYSETGHHYGRTFPPFKKSGLR